jgi:hypothetical protein
MAVDVKLWLLNENDRLKEELSEKDALLEEALLHIIELEGLIEELKKCI